MVTRPRQPVIVPIGQPLGTIYKHSEQGSVVPKSWVRVGDNVYELSPAQALCWEAAHATAPNRLTTHTRQELFDILREPFGAADADIDVAIESMLDLELLAEVPMVPEATVQFGRAYRMLALLNGIGNAPDRMEGFAFGMGDVGFSVAYIHDSEVINFAAAFGSVYAECAYLCDAIGSVASTAHLGTPEALTDHVVSTFAPYLSTHTVCFDLAFASESPETGTSRETGIAPSAGLAQTGGAQ